MKVSNNDIWWRKNEDLTSFDLFLQLICNFQLKKKNSSNFSTWRVRRLFQHAECFLIDRGIFQYRAEGEVWNYPRSITKIRGCESRLTHKCWILLKNFVVWKRVELNLSVRAKKNKRGSLSARILSADVLINTDTQRGCPYQHGYSLSDLGQIRTTYQSFTI